MSTPSAGLRKGSVRRVCRREHARRGFTLVEILFSVGIIFMLMALLFVGFRAAHGFANRTASTQTISTVKTGITLFEGEFGFLPPLVKDDLTGDGPLSRVDSFTGRKSVNIYAVTGVPGDPDLLALQGHPTTEGERRYSDYSLAFYLMGGLDKEVDGIDGPGCFEPDREGSFRTGGRRIEPMLDLSQGQSGLNWINREEGRVVLRDRVGSNIRYYRWEPEDDVKETEDLNVPELVGDASDNIEVRSSKYAIVVAGANGLFGDEPIEEIQEKLGLSLDPSTAEEAIAKARSDNVVGVGR